MGRFSVGQRVRDPDGDLCEIVGKPEKGRRLVRVLGGKYDGIEVPWSKSSLDPVNDNAEPEGVAAWTPKVGDRVRLKRDSRNGFGDTTAVIKAGEEVTITGEMDDGLLTMAESEGWVGYKTNTSYWVRSDDIEPIPATLTIEAGKFYRTRDGRKVGPMEVTEIPWTDIHGDTSAFVGRFDGHKDHYTAKGLWLTRYGEDRPEDLVAQWVEPTAWQAATEEPEPVAVAEATVTPEPRFKVGQKVRCVDSYPGSFTVGKEYTVAYYDQHGVPRLGVTRADHGAADGISAVYFEPASPPAKFKVGDRVITNVGYSFDGTVCTVKSVPSAEREFYVVATPDGNTWNVAFDDGLRLAPTIPIGATVTFTATGRLSAYTKDGHAQVTFPGLTPGQNSFALPAAFVSLAN